MFLRQYQFNFHSIMTLIFPFVVIFGVELFLKRDVFVFTIRGLFNEIVWLYIVSFVADIDPAFFLKLCPDSFTLRREAVYIFHFILLLCIVWHVVCAFFDEYAATKKYRKLLEKA
jgi:hypothetical protein